MGRPVILLLVNVPAVRVSQAEIAINALRGTLGIPTALDAIAMLEDRFESPGRRPLNATTLDSVLARNL